MSTIQMSFTGKDEDKGPSRPKIAVVGAGIIGVTSAYKIISEVQDVSVTLISHEFSPMTTGDGSAGLWGEYLTGEMTPQEKMHKWLKVTYDKLEEDNFSPVAPLIGVSQIYGCRLYADKHLTENCYWKDMVHGFSYMNEDDVKIYGNQFNSGMAYTSYTAECSKYLPYLMTKFLDKGGRIIKHKVDNLAQLIGKYDVVINCTGMGASTITPDPSVIPIRGQVIRVEAPWIKAFVIDEEVGNYIIPNINTVILGGTSQKGNYNLTPESTDAHNIWNGCCKMVPSVKHAKIIKHWVGLRPGRFAVRVERETISNASQKLEVIHNYGHAGSGITLSWGCASDVMDLLKDLLRSYTTNYNSKL